MGSRLWPFVVTWRYRSRDHSTPHGVFSIRGQWWPGVYQARLLRYSASKISGSLPWPFFGHVTSSVTWRHRSRDHSTPSVRFPIGGQWSPWIYLARLTRYSASKIMASRPWPFVVTWRHRSRDHWTPHVVFPIGGQWWPGVYLARLLRYSASKIMGLRPWPLGSRDVIGHVTIRLPMCGIL